MKMVALIRRKQGITPEQFRQHYESSHAPLISELLPFFIDYRRNYVSRDVEFEPAHVENAFKGPEFDVMTEITFASRADYDKMVAALQDEDIGRRIAADEEQFLDRETIALYITEEVRNA